MANFSCVHHIEVGAVDGTEAVHVLTSMFKFKVKAIRQTVVANQWLLVKNNSRFLVTSLKTLNVKAIQNDNFVVNWTSLQFTEDRKFPSKDSVFNIAFQVKDIDHCIKRLNHQGATFIKPLHTVHDTDGFVTTCVVKSYVGDVYHTLIEKNNYSGAFLPGFTPVTDDLETSDDLVVDPLLESFDHVTIAVEENTSMMVIDWYKKCFGMNRFMINKDEDDRDGLVIPTDEAGLRLRAMEYWKCAEVGSAMPEVDGVGNKLCMVIAEGLPPVAGSQEKSQIDKWMRQHGGPGIQHVAFTTSNIKSTVMSLGQAGAPFATPPPPTYYSQIGRLQDIKLAGEDANELMKYGILIDTEAGEIKGFDQCPSETPKRYGYLLQIFTRPVFRCDPFFIEIIQRKGATGFGSGNVIALYRSMQAFLVGEKDKHTFSVENIPKYQSASSPSNHV